MKKQKKKKKYINKFVFMITSLLLGIFFIISYFHNWANNLLIKLHFCNHIVCVIFSLIWFGFFVVSLFYMIKKKKGKTKVKRKMNKIWWLPFIIILIFGFVLMNMTYCDVNGDMHFGEFFGNIFGVEQTSYNGSCKPGTICCEHNCTVPIPPCLETDDGRDYRSYGEIRSGVNIDDICLRNGDLRERYCNSDLTYTSEDVDCAIEYGENWLCEEGECRYKEVIIENETDDNGDNGEDEVIMIDCTHDSVWPSCLGSCSLEPGDTKTYVEETTCSAVPTNEDGTEGICICLPPYEVICSESNAMWGLDCDGYCAYNMFCMHELDSDNCYCSDFLCYENDDGYDIFNPGTCIDSFGIERDDFCNGDILEEYQCLGDCMTSPTDCEVLSGGNYRCLEDENDIGYCGEVLE